MRRTFIAAIVSACIAFPTGALALGCENGPPDDRNELVSDYTKVANRHIDVPKVTDSARRLAGQGVFVRVRVFDTLEGKPNIEALADKWGKKCGWTTNGKLPVSSVFISMAVEKGDLMIWSGSATNQRITEDVTRRANAAFVPYWQSYKRDPNALTTYLVSTLDSFRTTLAQPLVAQGGGTVNTTIIHEAPKQATSLTGLWWVLAAIVLIGGSIAVVFVWSGVSQDRSEAQSAQSQARAARQKCLRRLLAITDTTSLATMEAMIVAAKPGMPEGKAAELDALFSAYKRQGEIAIAEFGRFDGVDKDDPNANGLSADAYRSNEQSYEDIMVNSIESAEESSRKISAMLDQAHSARVA